MKHRITKRDITFFFIGVLTISIISFAWDWNDNIQSFKDGYSAARTPAKSVENIEPIPDYVPADHPFYKDIAAMDKEYFDAYNHCDLAKQGAIYADDIEFYHDQGGLTTSKQDILEAIKANICGKVSRELVKGSMEVYSIKNYGAVEIGYHKFYNSEEPDAPSIPSKFIAVWQMDNENWRLSRIISLH